MSSEVQKVQKKRNAQGPPPGTVPGSAKTRKQDSRVPHVAEVRAIPEGERLSLGDLFETDSWTIIKSAASMSRESLEDPIRDFARYAAKTGNTRPEDTLEVLDRFIPVWNRRGEFDGKDKSYIIGTYTILQKRKDANSAPSSTVSQAVKKEMRQSIAEVFDEIGPDDYINFEQLKQLCWKDIEVVDSLTQDQLCSIINTYACYVAKDTRNPSHQTHEAYTNWKIVWPKVDRPGAIDEVHLTKALAVDHRLEKRIKNSKRKSRSRKDVDVHQGSLAGGSSEGMENPYTYLPAVTYNDLQDRDWWKKIDEKNEEPIIMLEYQRAIDDLIGYAYTTTTQSNPQKEVAERLRIAQDVRAHFKALEGRGTGLNLDSLLKQKRLKLKDRLDSTCNGLLATAAKSRARQLDLAKLKEGALESDEFGGNTRHLSKEQLVRVLKYYIKLAMEPARDGNPKIGTEAESSPDVTPILERFKAYMAYGNAKGWLDGPFNDALILTRDTFAARKKTQERRLKRQAGEGSSGAKGKEERGTKGKGNVGIRGEGDGGVEEERVTNSPLDELEECTANIGYRDPEEILALVNGARAFLEKTSFFDFGTTTEDIANRIRLMEKNLEGVGKVRDHAEAMISRSESSVISTQWECISTNSEAILDSLQDLIERAGAYHEFLTQFEPEN